MGTWQNTNKHNEQEPRGQPFPSRWPQGSNEQMRKHDKHAILITQMIHKRSTALDRSVKYFSGGLKPVSHTYISNIYTVMRHRKLLWTLGQSKLKKAPSYNALSMSRKTCHRPSIAHRQLMVRKTTGNRFSSKLRGIHIWTKGEVGAVKPA